VQCVQVMERTVRPGVYAASSKPALQRAFVRRKGMKNDHGRGAAFHATPLNANLRPCQNERSHDVAVAPSPANNVHVRKSARVRLRRPPSYRAKPPFILKENNATNVCRLAAKAIARNAAYASPANCRLSA